MKQSLSAHTFPAAFINIVLCLLDVDVDIISSVIIAGIAKYDSSLYTSTTIDMVFSWTMIVVFIL